MTVTELIENLESARIACGDEGFSVEEVAIDHAIEAISKLEYIANHYDDEANSNALARSWIHSLAGK